MQTALGRKIGVGANADVYEYGSGKVIKLFKSLSHANGIHSEFRRTMAVWQNGLPVPRPYEIVEFNGLPGLVQEYIEGETLADRMLKDDNQTAMRVLARLQFQLHSVSTEKLEIKDFHLVKGNLSRQISNSIWLCEDEKCALMSGLVELPDRNCLCHGDLHMLNVIMRGEEPIIIDWSGTSIGHPAYDVMQLLIILRYGIIPKGMLPQEIIDGFHLNRVKMESTFLDEYIALSGMKVEEIEAWMAPCAASRLNADISEEERQNLMAAIRKTVGSS